MSEGFGGMVRAGMSESELAQPEEAERVERLIELRPGLHSYPMPELGAKRSELTLEEVQQKLDRFLQEITEQGGRLIQIIAVPIKTGEMDYNFRPPSMITIETRIAIIDLPVEK